MNFKNFKVNRDYQFKDKKGITQYQVTIAPNTNSYWNWNYSKLVKEYPREVAVLKAIGFENKSRDLIQTGFKKTYTSKRERDAVADRYEMILSALIK